MPRPKKDGRFGQTKTVAGERALRMYMDAMKRNSEQIQIIKENK